MYKWIVLTIVLLSFTLNVRSTGTKPACSKSPYTKPSPSPEPNLSACKSYSCNSCCYRNITTELALSPLQQVGKINYDQCDGDISPACSMENTYFNCFFQCSPNLYPWINDAGKLEKIPICADFCDRLFFACHADMSCVLGEGNWLLGLQTGFNPDGTPKTPCIKGASCRNYTQIYHDGENLCNTIFGNLFQYSTDTNTCLDPSDPAHNADIVAARNPNNEVLKCENYENVHYTDTGMIVGIVFGVLGGIFLIVAGVAYYMRQKKSKETSPRASPKPAEMTTLRATDNDGDRESD